MAQYSNAYGKINLRWRVTAAEEEGVDADDAENILQLLMRADEEEDEEDEEDEEEVALAAAAEASALAEETGEGLASTSATEGQVSKKKKRKLNRRQLWRELPVFAAFTCLFILAHVAPHRRVGLPPAQRDPHRTRRRKLWRLQREGIRGRGQL